MRATGKTIAEVARDLKINDTTLGNWCRADRVQQDEPDTSEVAAADDASLMDSRTYPCSRPSPPPRSNRVRSLPWYVESADPLERLAERKMPNIQATYADESVEAWENSSLDARVYEGGDRDKPSTPPKVLSNMIEASYHAVSAGDVDAGAALLYRYVYEGPRALLTSVLGGYEVALDALLQFYPFRDLSIDPRTTNPDARRWIMHETALSLHVLGRMSQSAVMANRAATAALAAGDEHNASTTYHNLAETYLANGALNSCREVADAALNLALRSGNQEDVLVANTILGRLDDLTEMSEMADLAYARALQIASDATPFPILYSLSGVRYAEHLRISGRSQDALRVAEANLAFCESRGWQSDVASTLAQITTIPSHFSADELEQRSSDAISLARSIGHKAVLAESLLARARLKNHQKLPHDALLAAGEALTISQSYELRLAEVDSRLLLAATYASLGDTVDARAEAYLCRELAEQLDYRHGSALVEALERDWQDE
jgi:hypothetical protein